MDKSRSPFDIHPTGRPTGALLPAPVQIPASEFDPQDFPPNIKAVLSLDLFPYLSGPLSLPLMLVRGRRPGPVLLVAGGVHGDEFEGPESIRRFYELVDPNELSGTFIGLPMCNPWAYEGMKRESPGHIDGLNLARVFPGNPAGLPTERLAHHLIELVNRLLTPDDLFVDLHSGGTRYEYARLVGFRNVQNDALAASEKAARAFGIPNLWRLAPREVTFNGAVAALGIPTVGTEATGRGGCLEEDVATYVRGLVNCCRMWGMLPGQTPELHEGTPKETELVVVHASGFFRSPGLSLHSEVEAGQRLGSIVDPFGRPLETVTAPCGGEVWAALRFGTARAGEHVALIAH